WIVFVACVIFLRHPRVRRRLETRTLLPYTLFARYRFLGGLGAAAAKLRVPSSRKVPREIIDAHRAIRLEDMKGLRDIFAEMDALPTIQAGKAALDLGSMFELSSRNVHLMKSPFTHPLQYPPYLIPGVPAHTFYDPAQFEWARVLEQEFPVIKKELTAILSARGAGF